jgi:hypothetical protein
MASSFTFSCPNPRCSRGNGIFSSQRALLSHLRLSESCDQYLQEQQDYFTTPRTLVPAVVQEPRQMPRSVPVGITSTASHHSSLAGLKRSLPCDDIAGDDLFGGGSSGTSNQDAQNPVQEEARMETGSLESHHGSQESPPSVGLENFVAADFGHFSDDSDDDSSQGSYESIVREGYLDGNPQQAADPFDPDGDEPPPLLQPRAQARVSHDPNILAYEALENCMAELEAQREIISNCVENRCISDLIKKLEDAGSPDYLVCTVLTWARDAHDEGYDFHPRALGRNENINWMYKMLPNSEAYRPTMVEVPGLEWHGEGTRVATMATFDFATQVTSLLMDPELMVPPFLNLNPQDPLSMYEPPDGRLGEPLGASVCRAMYVALGAGNHLLAPVILFIDGTQFTSKANREMIPVTMTLAIFNIKARRQRKFWRLLGYIPDPHLGLSNNDRKKANTDQGYAARNFHRCMEAMLTGMRNCQTEADHRLKGVFLKLFGKWVTADVDTPLLLVINDGKQGDQLTGRYGNHTKGLKRHYRYCDCDFSNLANVEHICKPILAAQARKIAEHGTPEERQAHSTYHHLNAFRNIDMGTHKQGIHLAAPPETMHSIENGL